MKPHFPQRFLTQAEILIPNCCSALESSSVCAARMKLRRPHPISCQARSTCTQRAAQLGLRQPRRRAVAQEAQLGSPPEERGASTSAHLEQTRVGRQEVTPRQRQEGLHILQQHPLPVRSNRDMMLLTDRRDRRRDRKMSVCPGRHLCLWSNLSVSLRQTTRFLFTFRRFRYKK